MQFGINLLGKKEIVSSEEKEIIDKSKKTIVVTLVLYSLIMVIFLGSQFYLSREKNKIASQASQLEVRIKAYQKVESLEIFIKNRLGYCLKIINTRTHPEIILTKIINAKGEGLDISAVDLKKNNQISLSAESSDVGSLEEFVEKIKEVFSEEGYQTIVLESISRTKDGGYGLNLVAEK